jgi:hypothetical protein
MRLIDADEMRENLLWCKEQSGRFDNHWDDVIERLDAQPTITFEEIMQQRAKENEQKRREDMWNE